jgi:hypothetical protein
MEEDNHRREFENTDLYKKAREILKLTDHVAELCKHSESEEAEILVTYADQLRGDAMMIPPKIAGAYGADLYDIQMENAAIIRKAARDMLAATSGLKMMGLKDHDYLQLLRDALEEFRILFAEWVKTFDQWNYIIDRWGLFNPPGVNYDDPDPDGDIPFDPNDFI